MEAASTDDLSRWAKSNYVVMLEQPLLPVVTLVCLLQPGMHSSGDQDLSVRSCLSDRSLGQDLVNTYASTCGEEAIVLDKVGSNCSASVPDF